MITDPDAARIWTNCAQTIREQVGEAVWHTTFHGSKAQAFDQESLVVLVPTSLHKSRIERRYFKLINDTIDKTKPNLSVRIEIDPTHSNNQEANNSRLGSSDSTTPSETLPPESYLLDTVKDATNPEDIATGIETRLTFEHFVIGTSNRFSHAAALAVAESPAGAYNPLFIYSHSGLGKTHLLRAIVHYVNEHYSPKKVRYVTSETFLNEFIQAIRNKTQQDFQNTYRTNDVLLVDDIQFMAGKEGMQEEFFHTFNDLLQNGAQIVLSSDRAPDNMQTLEDRLRSRFKSGLITDIQPPDLVTRLAILEKKAELSEPTIPHEVLSFIAEHITDSIRELEGALIKVIAFASITKQQCSYELAQQVLADIITQKTRAPVTAEAILAKTAELFAIPIEQLTGSSRRRNLVDARQIAMYVTRHMTDLSFPEIGRVYGNRDHTTVMHAVRKIENHMIEQKQVFDNVQRLQEQIQSQP